MIQGGDNDSIKGEEVMEKKNYDRINERDKEKTKKNERGEIE